MRDELKVSDEFVNAFLDGQLDGDERGRVLNEIQGDKDLAGRVCSLRHVKELTQHAYSSEKPRAPKKSGGGGGGGFLKALAAGLLLAVGGVIGWVANDHAQSTQRLASMLWLNDSPGDLPKQVAEKGEKRIILHLSTGDPHRVKVALDTAEQLMASYQRNNEKVEIEFIANAQGLNLLRADVSPYAQRVQAMKRKYHNLTFLACSRAIQRLKEKGVDVKLLPDTKVAPSALEQILERLEEGWVYIKA
jgi:intracellular sulfur oxidation DsrE/DsrF family protein